MSISVQDYGLQLARLLCPWDFPGKNARVGCHSLLQGIFLTQGLNLHLLHLTSTGRWVVYFSSSELHELIVYFGD